jgi:HEPN domain-containing protein
MTPQEDARVLLALVDRHLRALRLNLDPAYPDEEWGFTAQQAVEKLLKVLIVLRDERPPFTHLLNVLAELGGGGSGSIAAGAAALCPGGPL